VVLEGAGSAERCRDDAPPPSPLAEVSDPLYVPRFMDDGGGSIAET